MHDTNRTKSKLSFDNLNSSVGIPSHRLVSLDRMKSHMGITFKTDKFLTINLRNHNSFLKPASLSLKKDIRQDLKTSDVNSLTRNRYSSCQLRGRMKPETSNPYEDNTKKQISMASLYQKQQIVSSRTASMLKIRSSSRIKNYSNNGYSTIYSKADKFNNDLVEQGQSKTLKEEMYGTLGNVESSVLEKARFVKSKTAIKKLNL